MEGVIKRLIDHLQSKRVSQGFCLLILALDELKPERGMSVHGKPVVLLKWTFLREYLRIPFSIQDDNGITFTTFYSHHA